MVKKLDESYTRVISDESGRMHYAIDSQLEAIRLMLSDIKEKLDWADKYERNLHIDGRADEDLYDVLFNSKKNLRKFSESLDDFCTIFTESKKINEGSNSNYESIAKTNPEKFAEIVAEFAQDMDWMDYVDDTLETPDEMWADFVDKTYDALMSDPEPVKDMIDDYGESDDPEALEIADLIDRYYIKKNESVRRSRTFSLNEAKGSTVFDIDSEYILELSDTPVNGMYELKSIGFDGYDSVTCFAIDYVSEEDYNEIKSHIKDQESAFDECGLGQLWSEASDIQRKKDFYDDDVWKAIVSDKDAKAFIKKAVAYANSNNMTGFFSEPFEDFIYDIDEDDKKQLAFAKKVATALSLDIDDYI